jgi:hypothetical protein
VKSLLLSVPSEGRYSIQGLSDELFGFFGTTDGLWWSDVVGNYSFVPEADLIVRNLPTPAVTQTQLETATLIETQTPTETETQIRTGTFTVHPDVLFHSERMKILGFAWFVLPARIWVGDISKKVTNLLQRYIFRRKI